jgi:hypothetical protein
MKKNHFFTYSKICTLALAGAGALFFTSCAKDGFDDETFDSGVSNTQVESISADDVTITPSADGKSQTISWPVVMGAGGYRVNLIDISNPNEPIINDSIVDGCSVTGKREEDVNYKLTILPLGNVKKQNTDASATAEKTFSTFTPTYMTIPAGSDLNAWFAQNPIPEGALTENYNYDLEGGANYTVSDVLDFDGYWVTLRSNSKSNHPKITYTAAASAITFSAPFNAKYLDFDCSGSAGGDDSGIFAFSKTSTVTPATEVNPEVYAWAGPLILNPITFISCNFDNVKGYFFWDNRVKTACMTMLVDNCVVHLTPEKSIGGGVFWTNKGGHINDLTVTNSTFWESIDCPGDFKYFYQAGMATCQSLYVIDTPSYKAATNSVNYTNSTFYHVAWNNGQWGNYNGMQSKAYSYWIMTDCIFYDCSTSGSVPRRFLHGRANQVGAKFNNNTYMKNDGTFQDPQNYDTSGTIIEEDPQFANPAAGDFHISGATQVARKTGDPRWLP